MHLNQSFLPTFEEKLMVFKQTAVICHLKNKKREIIMEKFKQLQKIKKLYAKGENIIQYLKSIGNSETNTIEDILISYDFQSGSYIQGLSKNKEYNEKYCKALAKLTQS